MGTSLRKPIIHPSGGAITVQQFEMFRTPEERPTRRAPQQTSRSDELINRSNAEMKPSASDGFDLDFPAWICDPGDDKGAVSFIEINGSGLGNSHGHSFGIGFRSRGSFHRRGIVPLRMFNISK